MGVVYGTMERCRKGDNLRRAFPFKELRAILPKVVERGELLIAGAGDARAILFGARLRNLWVDSGTGEWSIEEAAEFAAGGLEGSLLFF